MPPQDFVDEVSMNFRELLNLLNVSNDKFIRTTEEYHKKAVQVSAVGILAHPSKIGTWSPIIVAEFDPSIFGTC